MSNHYHLVVETVDGHLAQGMRQLNGVYTQRVNRRHARVGHVFQGRYKAILVERESYLLELARYVVLNPVRAGMVADAQDWPWSSYRGMLGLEQVPAWLQTDWLLGQFGPERGMATARYLDFVRAGVGLPSIWSGLNGPTFLGSEAFARGASLQVASAQRLTEVPRAQRRHLARPLSDYAQEPGGAKIAMMAQAYTPAGSIRWLR